MKKKLFIITMALIMVFTITGCGKKEEKKESNKENNKESSSQTKSYAKSYTCISEGEAGDGGKAVTKLVVYLDKDNYIVEHRIINDYTFKTKEMYESSKNATQNNIKIHNESKDAKSYKWDFESDDQKLHTLSTRIYDMSGIRDSQGKKYDSIYNYFNDDGTYNAEGWMAYNRERLNGGYTCSKDN